jgi:hypothetical protein
MRLAFVDTDEYAKSGAADAGSIDRLKYLRRFADDRLKPDLESVDGSAAVKVSGGYEDEIQIFVDQGKLAQLNLSIETIARRLREENVNLSGGRLEQGTQRFLVRTLNEFTSVQEMADSIVASIEGKPVYLRDVASVTSGYKDREAITRVDGRESVELAVYKEGDANTVQLAAGARERIEELGKSLPAGSELRLVYDQSRFISPRSARSATPRSSASLRSGPLPVLRDARDDDHRHRDSGLGDRHIRADVQLRPVAEHHVAGRYRARGRHARGQRGRRAREHRASPGTRATAPRGRATGHARSLDCNYCRDTDLGRRVLSDGVHHRYRGTAVQGPGADRQLLRCCSRWVADAVPMLAAPRSASRRRILSAARLAARSRSAGTHRLSRVSDGMAWLLSWGCARRRPVAPCRAPAPALAGRCKHRGRVMLISLACCCPAALVPRLGSELIPQLSQGEFIADLRLAPGTPLEQTDNAMATAQGYATELPEIALSYAVTGTGNRLDASPTDAGENTGRLSVSLAPDSSRDDESRVIDTLRGKFDGLAGVQYQFSRPALFSFASPLEVTITGYDLDRLRAVAEQIRLGMQGSPTFSDIKSTVEAGNPEIQIIFDQERAAQLCITVREFADRVVSSVRGNVATRYKLREKKIDVLVRSVDTRASSVEEIRSLIVNPGSDRPLPLSAVADVVVATGPAEIRRTRQQRRGRDARTSPPAT